MNERDDALADVSAAIDDVAMRLADLSELLHGRLSDLDEAEAAGVEYGPGDAACQRELTEDPWRVEKQMRKELQRLFWVTEGPDPKPVPPRRRPK